MLRVAQTKLTTPPESIPYSHHALWEYFITLTKGWKDSRGMEKGVIASILPEEPLSPLEEHLTEYQKWEDNVSSGLREEVSEQEFKVFNTFLNMVFSEEEMQNLRQFLTDIRERLINHKYSYQEWPLFGDPSKDSYQYLLPCTLYEGTRRPADSVVVEAVDFLVIQGGKPKILELGAGYTYAPREDFGSPWLARRLALKYGDNIRMVVTNHYPSLKHHTLLSKNSQYYPSMSFRSITESLTDDASEPTILPGSSIDYEGGPSFKPLSENEKRQLLIILKESSSLKCPFNNPDSLFSRKDEVYLRPAIDPEVEQLMFGLEMHDGVGYSDVAAHFPGERFDLIYLRHVPPISRNKNLPDITNDEIVAARESLREMLAPGGVVILQLDHPINDGVWEGPVFATHDVYRGIRKDQFVGVSTLRKLSDVYGSGILIRG